MFSRTSSKSILFFCSLLLSSNFSIAQANGNNALEKLDRIKHQHLDIDAAAKRQSIDLNAKAKGKFGLGVGPTRVAVAIPTSINIIQAASRDYDQQGTLLRYRFSSPGASFLSFNFSDFDLPQGAELHFISVAHDFVDGPYSRKHHKPQGTFASPMVPGDSAVIEVRLINPDDPAVLNVSSVSHGYKDSRISVASATH